jgi:simple sugar transport system permease protein
VTAAAVPPGLTPQTAPRLAATTGRRVAPIARAIAITAATAAMATLALAALLLLAGYDAGRALRALWEGSVGSSYALLSATLVRATPLILAGLAVTIAFTTGVLNIGAEGQLLAGATAAAAVGVTWGTRLGASAPVVELAAGALAGTAWALPAAELRRRFGVLEVISTIMLNFVAANLISYLVRGPLQEPTHVYPQTETIVVAAQMPRLGPVTRLHFGFVIAVIACALSWWIIRYTAAGFRLRVVGANPNAARVAGQIDVARTTMRAFLLSGALAGLAGALEVSGVTYALYENISPGYGYTAIAVALLARLDAALVIVTGILFGALEAGASAMQRDAGVPSVVVSVVEAAIILVLVGLERARVVHASAT